MAKSIITEERKCYICGSQRWIERHHVFFGANHKASDKYGLIVPLCHYCHNEPPSGVHFNKELCRVLQSKVQKIAMKYYDWDMEEWRSRFGRNYATKNDL
jgi:hypothetical protein